MTRPRAMSPAERRARMAAIRLIPFTVVIPEPERDLALKEKLREELPGILHWAVASCLEWQRDGLKPPTGMIEAPRTYRKESDTLGRFIGEYCTVRNLDQVKSGVFFQHYQRFAETGGECWISHKDLPSEMQRRGFESKTTKFGGMYYGIELNVSGSSDHWSN